MLTSGETLRTHTLSSVQCGWGGSVEVTLDRISFSRAPRRVIPSRIGLHVLSGRVSIDGIAIAPRGARAPRSNLRATGDVTWSRGATGDTIVIGRFLVHQVGS